jgi:hypothetical protein
VTIEKEIPLDESCPLYKSLIFDPILLLINIMTLFFHNTFEIE